MSLFSECELSFEAARSVSEPSSEPGIASPTPANAVPSGRRRFRHIERNQPTFVLVDVNSGDVHDRYLSRGDRGPPCPPGSRTVLRSTQRCRHRLAGADGRAYAFSQPHGRDGPLRA